MIATGFYISVSNGLLKDGHRKRMGEAVWEFMWFLDKLTRIDENGDGWVLGGKPINLQDIADDMGVPRITVQRHVNVLEKECYIRKIRAPHGMVIIVVKAKKIFKERVIKNDTSLKERCIKNDTCDVSNMIQPCIKNDTCNKTIQDNTVDNEFEQSSNSPLSEEYVQTDEDGNELTKRTYPNRMSVEEYRAATKKPPPKNKIAFALIKEFSDMAYKNLRTRPVQAAKSYFVVTWALKRINENQVLSLFKEWFESGEPDDHLIQITRALSANNINKFKLEHGIE